MFQLATTKVLITRYFIVAVGAFALVVTLDLTRRENDRKMVAVKVQMCDLMAVFFEYVPSFLTLPSFLIISLSPGSGT